MSNLTTKQRSQLQKAFEHALGDREAVRFDPYHRELYSTDASNHRLVPLGVVIPSHQEQLSQIVETAAELEVPVLPRGAGTSLAGQAIGRAVIVDVGKNLNKIVSLNPEEQTAVVEPGVTCLQLNRRAANHGLGYGPDPASADRATFGGMIGNNATGAHSIQYGMTADNLTRLWVTLADGSDECFEALSSELWHQKMRDRGLAGRIYRTADRMRDEYRQAIEDGWPRTWRRASGYSINYLTGFSPGQPPTWAFDQAYPPEPPTNLAPMLAGSEGTLAIFRQAEVRLVPTASARSLVLLSYESVLAAVRQVPELLDRRPAAIELIPRTLLERAATIPAYARKLTFLEHLPEALLVVEFVGESEAEAVAKAQPLAGAGILLSDNAAQADLWSVRKAGLGLLMSVPGHEKPITFIEDIAVPVEHLADYVAEVERVLEQHNVEAAWYAHASAGCLHLRPMINPRSQAGVRLMRSIADQVAAIVLSLNGSMSGEHGDGLSHSEYNQQLFGPKLMQAFHELKAAFDPAGLLNPGKIIPSDSAVEPALDQNLRFDEGYQTIEINTHFAHKREGGLAGAVEACVGLGVCRKDDGLMCPSYQATREEMDVTRGRANALRAALAGQLPAGSLTSEQMHDVYDLCLECKGCKAECPTGVDIGRVKAEFLALYGQEHGYSLRSRLFANIRRLSGWIHLLGPLLGSVADWRIARSLQESLLDISRYRKLPPFKRQTFSQWFDGQDHASDSENRVVLFLDSYTEYSYPEIGRAAVRVLRAAGHKVELVRQQGCCGRPMISKGFLEQAKAQAQLNLEALSPYVRAGVPIIGLEPSCISVLRDEHLEFFPDDPRAKLLARNTFMIEEFLVREHEGPAPVELLDFNPEQPSPIRLHSHCHTKALTGSQALHRMLSAAGYRVDEIDSGCCGMAGSFGYEREHYGISMQIGELHLLPAVRQASMEGVPVATQGVSCRTQIRDGAAVEAKHPIQLVAYRLAEEESDSSRGA